MKLGVKKRGYHLRKFTGPLSFIVTTVLGIVTTPFSIYIIYTVPLYSVVHSYISYLIVLREIFFLFFFIFTS